MQSVVASSDAYEPLSVAIIPPENRGLARISQIYFRLNAALIFVATPLEHTRPRMWLCAAGRRGAGIWQKQMVREIFIRASGKVGHISVKPTPDIRVSEPLCRRTANGCSARSTTSPSSEDSVGNPAVGNTLSRIAERGIRTR